MCLRVIRQGRLKQIIASLQQRPVSICARTDDPFHRTGIAEDVSAIRGRLRLALIQLSLAAENLKMAIKAFTVESGGNRQALNNIRGHDGQ